MPPRPRPSPSSVPPPAAAGFRLPAGWMGVLVFCATFLAYLPVLKAGFIWDDAGHVTRADLRPFSGLIRIWFEIGATQQYYPLLHTAFWLEHGLWGDAPLGYHLTNILLHAGAACLFALILRRLAVPGAWLAAFLFALHPVGVESVAWVSEQKNTLSAIFYLGAALVYLRFDLQRRGRTYALATALFIMALLTKSVTATLPAALLVVFWWQRGRLSWRRDALLLLPWFALSAVAGWVTASVERTQIGAKGADFALSALQRCLVAGRAIWFYLGTLLWPSDLIFIYPRWNVDAAQAWQYLFPLGALALLAALVWLWRKRQLRGPLAAFLFFAGTLFPALGFINVYPFIFSFVADHFQYLASLAVMALAAVGLIKLSAHLPAGGGPAVIVAILGVLGGLTWAQAGTYRDVFTLYETTIARNPACWMAHNNLAMALTEAGRPQEAIPHLEIALRLRPDFAQAESNLGDNLTHLGRPAEAIPHLEHALQLQPNYPEALNNLGAALMDTGHPADGIAKFGEALRLNPTYAMAHLNLGAALARNGRAAEAIPHFEEAVRLNPDYAENQYDWALTLAQSGHLAESFPHFEEALRLKPDYTVVHSAYAYFLAQAGKSEEANRERQKARALGAP